jgi:hypothetical protein
MASEITRLTLLLTALHIDQTIMSILSVLGKCGLGVDSIEVMTVLHLVY